MDDASIKKRIAKLEKSEREAACISAPAPSFSDAANLFNWVFIKSLVALSKGPAPISDLMLERMEDILCGFRSFGIPAAFCVFCQNEDVKIGFGTPANQEREVLEEFTGLLRGHFPGCKLVAVDTKEFRQVSANFIESGIACGVPSLPDPQKDKYLPGQHLERLIRGMWGLNWAMLVIFKPHGTHEVSSDFNAIADDIFQVEQAATTKGSSREANRLGKYLAELLEKELERFGAGKSLGMWSVQTTIWAEKKNHLYRALGILRSIYGGKGVGAEPFRVMELSRNSRNGNYSLDTVLHSGELALLCTLPEEEFSGYAFRDSAVFDVHYEPRRGNAELELGVIQMAGESLKKWYSMPYNELSRHALVCGVTGSGKTHTIKFILEQCNQKGIPFMVIEPAKIEYRNMRELNKIKNLKIYSLGDPKSLPIRINPFAFPEGIGLHTHIDMLMNIFQASFVLYAPMPYILEHSIHEIYRARGWQFNSGDNPRGHHKLAFPTLADLEDTISNIVDRQGYDTRLAVDIKAALTTRIRTLRIGTKGLLLNTRDCIPQFKEIMNQPTLLELQAIGDDDVKAFLIALIYTSMYEYWITQGQGNGIRHLMVIEEAHRLLKNVPLEKSSEDATNMRGKTVELFCNILSEIRAYGEGIVVSEQIPTKLAPDVIKNTNLKIVHRLVSKDEREAVGGATNMNEDQVKELSILDRGTAICFAEGEDRPLRLRIPDWRRGRSDAKANISEAPLNEDLFKPFPLCPNCKAKTGCVGLGDRTNELLNDEWTLRAFEQLLFKGLVNDHLNLNDLDLMAKRIRSLFASRSEAEALQFLFCAMFHLAESSLDKRSQFYRIKFRDQEWLQQKLMKVIFAALTERPFRTFWKEFKDRYLLLLQTDQGPYPGCELCSRKCKISFDAEHLFPVREIMNEFYAIMTDRNMPENRKLQKAATMISTKAAVTVWSGKDLAICLTNVVANKSKMCLQDTEKLCSIVSRGK